jgi:formamidopyrimidine-DNA glycosylase
MPELPEVETVRRGLEGALVGARFERVEQRRPNLRFPFPERFGERLEGVRMAALERRAKYLLGRLESGDVLAMHLGMSGRFTVHQTNSSGHASPEAIAADHGDAHDHVVFHMSSNTRVVYNDVRRFGFMDLIGETDLAQHKLFRGLGVEPLSDDLTPAFMAGAFANKQTPIKAALLDQKLIAGLGNIYVCEALHRAGLSPERTAASLAKSTGGPGVRANRLTEAVKSVLADAIAAGGSSLKDYQHADGSLGYFQHSFAVYGREGQNCPRAACRGTIQRIVQSGRSTFFCARCQR